MNGLIISKNSMVGENGGDFEQHDDFRRTELFRINFEYGRKTRRGQSYLSNVVSKKFYRKCLGFFSSLSLWNEQVGCEIVQRLFSFGRA